MKTVIRLGFLLAFSSVLFSSCKKDELVSVEQTVYEPNITSKIYPYTTQPAATTLGTAQTAFHEGDVVTLYIPYGVYKDEITSASLAITDASTADVINTYSLTPSTDPSADQLDVPKGLREVPFMFVTFTVDNSFTGKSVNLSSAITGSKTSSEDVLNNAFSVGL